MSNSPSPETPSQAPVHGLLAEFSEVDKLLTACAAVRDQGYTHWDAHTPFAVHGLDEAMGVKPTRLPWFILLCGLTGMFCGLALQWYTNAYDYPFRISGKPTFSLPANIPVIFEMTVLFSAFAAIFGSLALGKLPGWFNPLFSHARFRRATADRFFIYIESSDPKFTLEPLTQLLQQAQANVVEPLFYDRKDPLQRLPKGLLGVTAALVVISFIPLAMIARARETTSELPRIHVIPDDMDNQYKFKAQAANWFFHDGRAMRVPPEGTVAQEDGRDARTFFTGKMATPDNAVWSTTFPSEVPLNEVTMQRGKARFATYCAPCHGYAGYGDGMVAQHAEALNEGTWVMPASLHDERVRQEPVGEIFNSLTHGIRSMPAYGHLINDADRWAIVLYVKALQRSQHAPLKDVPTDVLPTLQ